MSELAQAWTSLPNLHPLAVHVPVALLPLAVLIDLLAVARPRSMWLDRAAALLYALGALGAVLAVEIGENAAESFVDIPPHLQSHIAEHSDWAHYVLYSFAVIALARVVLCWRDRRNDAMSQRGVRLLVVVVAAAGLYLLAHAADLGGGLVYEHGLGVTVGVGEEGEMAEEEAAAEEHPAPAAAEPEKTADAATRVSVDDHGVVTWQPIPQDAGSLASVLQAVHGTTLDVVSPAEESGETGITVRVDGRAVLELRDALGDVQVDAKLDLLDFEGTVGVAHHLGSGEQGGFFTLSSSGSVELVDRRNGERQVLEEASVEVPEGSFVLGVSSAGRHLKGLLDGETVAHAHLSPLAPGGCGLLLDGRGTVRILGLVVTPLEHE